MRRLKLTYPFDIRADYLLANDSLEYFYSSAATDNHVYTYKHGPKFFARLKVFRDSTKTRGTKDRGNGQRGDRTQDLRVISTTL